MIKTKSLMVYWLRLHIRKYVHWIISCDSNVLVLIEMKLKSQIQMLKNIHTDVSLIKEKKKIIATLHEGNFNTI